MGWKTAALAGALLAIGPQALAQEEEGYRYAYTHPHMMGDWGWGGMIFGPIMGLLSIAVIVVVIVMVVRWLGGEGGARAAPRGRAAIQILEERFARGEIDKDEFEERKRLLSD